VGETADDRLANPINWIEIGGGDVETPRENDDAGRGRDATVERREDGRRARQTVRRRALFHH
jgi:hypothetical protein